MHRWIVLGVVLLPVIAFVGRLDASNFTVNPMQVVFTPGRKSAVVTLKNLSKADMRFQIKVFTWDQSPSGEMLLGDTNDVVFFPQLLELGAGQQRPIRLGITGPIGAVEKSYRIFFEELPGHDRLPELAANGVQMRVKIGLPVFVSPRNRGTALVTIRNARQRDGHVALSVENSGTNHVVVNTVRVRGLDARGQRLFERSIRGWYVLARHNADYDVPLSGGDCAATSLAIEVLVGRTVIRDRINGPLTGCR